MRRNFILPSETLAYTEHDCRLENLKYKFRDPIYDVSVLSNILARTKSSINLLYDNYLLHPEDDLKRFGLFKVKNEDAKSSTGTNKSSTNLINPSLYFANTK